MSQITFVISDELDGQTLAAVLRNQLNGLSWNDVRKLVTSRRVKIDGELRCDPAMRLRAGMVVELSDRPERKPQSLESIVFRHVDSQLVVVEKPAGLSTVRHPAERDWPERRKALEPTLIDLVYKKLATRETQRSSLPRLRVVQRLDKDTSGLLVFARTHIAERELGKQFHDHLTLRKYLAIIPGQLRSQTFTSQLIRDRGDGLRGSTSLPDQGKLAVTHVQHLESAGAYSLIACRLETGRTHQIRIHLSEAGHPICGEKVYVRKRNGESWEDSSGAPRLALHAAELGFAHPATQEKMFWQAPLPADLATLWQKLARTLD